MLPNRIRRRVRVKHGKVCKALSPKWVYDVNATFVMYYFGLGWKTGG